MRRLALSLAILVLACKGSSKPVASQVSGSNAPRPDPNAPPTADMVRIPRSGDGSVAEFFLDKDEVTAAQYADCIADHQCDHPSREDACSEDRVDVYSEGNRPVTCVMPMDAEKYCLYRHKRLPTKTEWLHAARGDDRRSYPWGSGAPNCENAVMDLGSACHPTKTQPVGSKPAGASPYGVMDLVGNVAEYVVNDTRVNDADPLTEFTLMGGDYQTTVDALHDLELEPKVWGGPQFGFRCAWSEDMQAKDGKIPRSR